MIKTLRFLELKIFNFVDIQKIQNSNAKNSLKNLILVMKNLEILTKIFMI